MVTEMGKEIEIGNGPQPWWEDEPFLAEAESHVREVSLLPYKVPVERREGDASNEQTSERASKDFGH